MMHTRWLYTFCSLVPLSLTALPKGEEVKSGKASFSRHEKALAIHAEDKTILNFESFEIALDEKVQFLQPSKQATVLGRVQGNDPTSILGELSSNGRVFLVNPFGVYFGKDAVVDVGSLVATTMDILDEDFLKDTLQFKQNPQMLFAKIVNEGTLKAAPEGAIVLLAPHIENEGRILADVGKVILASQERMTLDFSGDGLICFSVEGTFAEGQQMIGLQEAGRVLKDVINVEGITLDTKLVKEGGVVRLVGTSTVHADDVVIIAPRVHVEGEIIAERDLSIEANVALALRDKDRVPLVMHAYRHATLESSLIDILAWENPYTSLASGGHMTLISERPISADGKFYSGGDFSMRQRDGTPTAFVSLFDPIVTSAGAVTFGTYMGPSLKVEAGGTITCTGTITITGPDVAACPPGFCMSDPDCVNNVLTTQSVLILIAGTPPASPMCNAVPQTFSGTMFTNPGGTGSTITLGGDISGIQDATFTGDVVFTAASVVTSSGGMTFNGTIDGSVGLTLTGSGSANTIQVNGAIGSQAPLSSLTVTGSMSFVSESISAGLVSIGDSSSFILEIGDVTTTLSGGMTVTASGSLQVSNASCTGGGGITLNLTAGGVGHFINLSGNMVSEGDIVASSIGTIALYGDSSLTSTMGNISLTGTEIGANGLAPESFTLSAPMGMITATTTIDPGIGSTNPPTYFAINGAGSANLPAITTESGGVGILAETLTLNGNITTLGGPIVIDAMTTITQPMAFVSMGGNIAMGSVDGMQTFLVNASSGIISFVGPLGSMTPLTSLTATGSLINIGANMTTVTSIDLTGQVIMIGNSTLMPGTTLNINGGINGTFSLSVQSNDQPVTITGNIGAFVPLSTFSATGFHTFNAEKITAGSININYEMSTLGTVTVNALTGTGSGGITVVAGSQLTMNSAVSSGSVLLSSTGPITMTANSTITSSNGNVTITGTGLDAQSAGAQSLTLGAPNGNVNVTTTASTGIGSNTIFSTVTLTGARNGSLPAINTQSGVSLTANNLTLSGPYVSAVNGPVTVNGSMTLTSPTTTFTFSSGGGPIALNGSVNFNMSLLDIEAGSGVVTLGGAIVGTAVGGQLKVVGSTINQNSSITLNNAPVNLTSTFLNLGGNITTGGGSVTISSGTVLLNGSPNVIIDTRLGGAITIAGDINGSGPGHSLALLSGLGLITFGGNVGDSVPLNVLAATGANINFQGNFYAANTQIYTSTMNFNFTSPSLVTLESFGGEITFLTGNIKLGSGADLLVETNGGPFNFFALYGTSGQNVDIITSGAPVTLGQMGMTNDLNAVLVLGGNILLKGPITVDVFTASSSGSILNFAAPQLVTTRGNATFNALAGTVGTSTSPISVNAGFLVFAGAPQQLANFIGTTQDGTIHPIPQNPPCPLIFNGTTLISCAPAPVPFRLPSIPARDWYVQGIYSIYNNLADYYYFLPEVVTDAYVTERPDLLYWLETPSALPNSARSVRTISDNPS